MWFAYTVTELASATKPRLMGHLLDRYGETGPPTSIPTSASTGPWRAWRGSRPSTPSCSPRTLIHPIPQDVRQPERPDDPALRGVQPRLHLGEPGRRGSSSTGGAQRLESLCLVAPDRGLNGDQRWVDLAPVPLRLPHPEGPHLQRGLLEPAAAGGSTASEGRFLIDGEPLTFFHFSAYDPHRPWVLTRHGGTPAGDAAQREPGAAAPVRRVRRRTARRRLRRGLPPLPRPERSPRRSGAR